MSNDTITTPSLLKSSKLSSSVGFSAISMDHVVEQTCAVRGKKGKSRANGNDANIACRERDANWSDRETNILLNLLDKVQSSRQDPNGNGGYNDQE